MHDSAERVGSAGGQTGPPEIQRAVVRGAIAKFNRGRDVWASDLTGPELEAFYTDVNLSPGDIVAQSLTEARHALSRVPELVHHLPSPPSIHLPHIHLRHPT